MQLEMREKPHERDQGATLHTVLVSNLRVSNSKAIEVGANHGRATSALPNVFVRNFRARYNSKESVS